ncbi:MAG: hypothetical protein AB7O97_06370 [Planctomycetota bacterium]
MRPKKARRRRNVGRALLAFAALLVLAVAYWATWEAPVASPGRTIAVGGQQVAIEALALDYESVRSSLDAVIGFSDGESDDHGVISPECASVEGDASVGAQVSDKRSIWTTVLRQPEVLTPLAITESVEFNPRASSCGSQPMESLSAIVESHGELIRRARQVEMSTLTQEMARAYVSGTYQPPSLLEDPRTASVARRVLTQQGRSSLLTKPREALEFLSHSVELLTECNFGVFSINGETALFLIDDLPGTVEARKFRSFLEYEYVSMLSQWALHWRLLSPWECDSLLQRFSQAKQVY